MKEKKKAIEAENEKDKGKKVEKVVLSSWIDAEIEHLNSEKFKY